MMKRLIPSLVCSALALGVIVSPAWAEGLVSSRIEWARPEFKSRSWTDKDLDTQNSRVRFTGCKGVGGNTWVVDIDLRRERSYLPDASAGVKKIDCQGVDTDIATWGREAAGSWHFRLDNFVGAQVITVKTVYIGY